MSLAVLRFLSKNKRVYVFCVNTQRGRRSEPPFQLFALFLAIVFLTNFPIISSFRFLLQKNSTSLPPLFSAAFSHFLFFSLSLSLSRTHRLTDSLTHARVHIHTHTHFHTFTHALTQTAHHNTTQQILHHLSHNNANTISNPASIHSTIHAHISIY